MAGGHARVVRNLSAPAAQLRPRPLRAERAPAARPAPALAGARSMRPGPWLRLLSIASAAGVAAVVATGEWGLAHDVVANVTLVLLAAVVLCARLAYRNRRTLLTASGSAFLLFALAGLSALVGAPTAVHLGLGAASLVAAVVAAAVCARGGEPAPRAA